jgi:predicted transcriptional regulator YheO
MFIRGESGKPAAILGINYDITNLLALESAIAPLTSTAGSGDASSVYRLERIPLNVSDLLDELITQSIRLIGKPVPMMSKDDKIRAIQFLNDSGIVHCRNKFNLQSYFKTIVFPRVNIKKFYVLK